MDEADVLAHMTFPTAHRLQIQSTNPLEQLNAEIKRRTGVVGIFRRPSRDWSEHRSWSKTTSGSCSAVTGPAHCADEEFPCSC